MAVALGGAWWIATSEEAEGYRGGFGWVGEQGAMGKQIARQRASLSSR